MYGPQRAARPPGPLLHKENFPWVWQGFWPPQWLLMSDGFIKLLLWQSTEMEMGMMRWKRGVKERVSDPNFPLGQPADDTLFRAIKRGKSPKVKTYFKSKRARFNVSQHSWAKYLRSPFIPWPLRLLVFSHSLPLVVNTENKSKIIQSGGKNKCRHMELYCRMSHTKDKVLAPASSEKSLFYSKTVFEFI